MRRKSIRKEITLLSGMIRENKVSSLRNTLDRLNALIPWEQFRPILERVRKPSPKGGRPPYDEVFMFKCLILQELYGLSDEELEYQIADRCSFQKFLGMNIASDVPDYGTINRFRNLLKEQNLVADLNDQFYKYLRLNGLILRKGVIADATFVEAPRQRNTRKENAAIKANLPSEEAFPDKSKQSRSHKDVDARWTSKNGVRHFGYKNHILCDSRTKLIIDYEATPANVHDSRLLTSLLPPHSENFESVYADSAYGSSAIESELKRRCYKSEIVERGRRGHPLTPDQKENNRSKSRIRSRVEHVFGDIKNRRGGLRIMTIGLDSARTKIGLINLAYNMRRFLTLTLQQTPKNGVLWG